jgi:hypothetical protein
MRNHPIFLSLPTRTILALACPATGLLAADPAPPASGNGLTLMSNQEFGVFWKEMQAQNMAKFPGQSWPKPPPEAIES